MNQLFFIEGRLIASVERKKVWHHESLCPPTSDLYFCEHCGEVYAKCPVMLEGNRTTGWQSYRMCCRKCAVRAYPSMFQIPGSLWRSWDADFAAALPVPVLQWELERHIEHFERINHEGIIPGGAGQQG